MTNTRVTESHSVSPFTVSPGTVYHEDDSTTYISRTERSVKGKVMSLYFFGIDRELDQASGLKISSKLKEMLSQNQPGQFVVILHNDPINGVEYVTGIIKNVFGYSTGKAVWLMLKAHFTGRSRLWLGGHKQALEKMNQMVSFGPDPNMVHKGAKPLKVTVE